jgi:hypothetical protein
MVVEEAEVELEEETAAQIVSSMGKMQSQTLELVVELLQLWEVMVAKVAIDI